MRRAASGLCFAICLLIPFSALALDLDTLRAHATNDYQVENVNLSIRVHNNYPQHLSFHVQLKRRADRDQLLHYMDELQAVADTSCAIRATFWYGSSYIDQMLGDGQRYAYGRIIPPLAPVGPKGVRKITVHGKVPSEMDSLRADRLRPENAVQSWLSDMSEIRYDLLVTDSGRVMQRRYPSGRITHRLVIQQNDSTWRWEDEEGFAHTDYIVHPTTGILTVNGAWNGVDWDGAAPIDR